MSDAAPRSTAPAGPASRTSSPTPTGTASGTCRSASSASCSPATVAGRARRAGGRNGAYRHFCLDGQAIVLEDYLAVRPEDEARIRRLAAAGALALGPFYVLPGRVPDPPRGHGAQPRPRVARWPRASDRCSRSGYVPDAFGHVAQLPQILRLAGIDSFIYTRGDGDEIDELGLEWIWEAPDGTEVLAVHQCGGYCNAASPRATRRSGTPTRSARSTPTSPSRKVRELFERMAARVQRRRVAPEQRLRPLPRPARLRRACSRRSARRSPTWSSGTAASPSSSPPSAAAGVRDEALARRAARRQAPPRALRRVVGAHAAEAAKRRGPHPARRRLRAARPPTLRFRHGVAVPARPAGARLEDAARRTSRTTPSAAAPSTPCTARWSRASTGSSRPATPLVREALTGARPDVRHRRPRATATPCSASSTRCPRRARPSSSGWWSSSPSRATTSTRCAWRTSRGGALPFEIVGAPPGAALLGHRLAHRARRRDASRSASTATRATSDTAFLEPPPETRPRRHLPAPALPGRPAARGARAPPARRGRRAPEIPVLPDGGAGPRGGRRTRSRTASSPGAPASGRYASTSTDRARRPALRGPERARGRRGRRRRVRLLPGRPRRSVVTARGAAGTLHVVDAGGLQGRLEARFVLPLPAPHRRGPRAARRRRRVACAVCRARDAGDRLARGRRRRRASRTAPRTTGSSRASRPGSGRHGRLRRALPPRASAPWTARRHEDWCQPPPDTVPQQEFTLVSDGDGAGWPCSCAACPRSPRSGPATARRPPPHAAARRRLALARRLPDAPLPERRAHDRRRPTRSASGAQRFRYAVLPFGGDALAAEVKGWSRRWRTPLPCVQGVVDGGAAAGRAWCRSRRAGPPSARSRRTKSGRRSSCGSRTSPPSPSRRP